jgi:hypothetical protein
MFEASCYELTNKMMGNIYKCAARYRGSAGNIKLSIPETLDQFMERGTTHYVFLGWESGEPDQTGAAEVDGEGRQLVKCAYELFDTKYTKTIALPKISREEEEKIAKKQHNHDDWVVVVKM